VPLGLDFARTWVKIIREEPVVLCGPGPEKGVDARGSGWEYGGHFLLFLGEGRVRGSFRV